MESILGKEHDMVMHALIPYDLGGSLDLYYYPNGIKGTGIATKELSNACRTSSSNNTYKKYEFVMFTKHEINLDDTKNLDTDFGKTHNIFAQILNSISRYSEQATLNPNETCEFPQDFEGIGGKCLLFIDYAQSTNKSFGMMLIMEVFRSEMEFARTNGTAQLIQIFKKQGVYPYSDIQRDKVE